MSDEHQAKMERTGGCMCGAVRYKAEFGESFATCYCKMCQRWSGGSYMGTTSNNFEVTQGKAALVIYKSSDWAVRAFCGTCGSNIYYHAEKFGGPSVAIGSLDDTSGLALHMQYFIDKQPEGFSLAESSKSMTSADIARAMGSGASD